MAFISKVGNLLKQSVNRHINLELSASNPSIYQAIRCMSSSKLFVGGLSYNTDDQSLREAFAAYGEVIEARVIMDRETGRSRGFGFVSYTSSEEASSAIQALDQQELHGRRVRVNYAADRAGGFRSGGFGGGSYGGSGGYGGDGGGGYGGSGGAGGGGYGGDNYGSVAGGGGGSYGSGGGYGGSGGGGGTYGSGGYSGGDSYGSGGGAYGGGNYGSGASGGGGGSYGSGGGYGGGNYSVAGGGGGSDNYVSGSAGGDGSYTSGGYSGSTGVVYGSGDRHTSNLGNSTGAKGYGEADPLEESSMDNDDEPNDYANRRG